MKKNDSYIVGVAISILIPFFIYTLFRYIFYYQNKVFSSLLNENLLLFLIALNGIVFWYFMVKRELEKTGKAIFLVTLLYVIIYVIIYHV